MTQDPKQLPSPTGVVFNTSMSRPDAALALAALHVLASRREARVDGVCVAGSGFAAAVYCDIVARFYAGGFRAPSSNNVLPIGFPSDTTAPDPPMVQAAIARRRADGQAQFARSIERVTDTSLPEAMLRNAVTFTPETVVVLSAPATWLAKSVTLSGVAAQYKQRVKRVVIVEAGDVEQDRAALDALVAALPVPVVRCGREVGEGLAVPRERIEAGFAWAPVHPVADALHAAGQPNVPLHDLAAVYYALHPTSDWFVDAAGRLSVAPSSRDECAAALVALATSRPAPPPGRGSGLL
jgi:hypothetical protein